MGLYNYFFSSAIKINIVNNCQVNCYTGIVLKNRRRVSQVVATVRKFKVAGQFISAIGSCSPPSATMSLKVLSNDIVQVQRFAQFEYACRCIVRACMCNDYI